MENSLTNSSKQNIVINLTNLLLYVSIKAKMLCISEVDYLELATESQTRRQNEKLETLIYYILLKLIPLGKLHEVSKYS